MVRRELKPSFLAASCWMVLVVNGAPGRLLRRRFSTLETTKGRLRTASTTARASASLPSWGLWPSILASDSLEGLAAGGAERLDGPVLLRLEGADLPLPLHDEPERHGLDPAGGETGLDRAPEDGARLVADQPIENPAGLLGLDLLLVDGGGAVHGRHDRVAGDLLEQHPVHRHPLGRRDLVGDVPGDRLAFAVGVGGEIDGRRGLGRLLELGQRLGLALDGDVLGLEPVVDVHPQLAGGEIAQVPDRRLHVVAPTEVLPDGLGLGGRLDDDERISRAGHGLGPRLLGLGLRASGRLLGRLLGLGAPWRGRRVFTVCFGVVAMSPV